MQEEPAAARIATLVGIVSQLYTTQMGALLKEHGLTLAQFALLNHLSRNSGRAEMISQLADALEVRQPGVSKIVQRLNESGLIGVSEDPDDRRQRRVAITKQGRARLDQVRTMLGPEVDLWFADWDAADLRAFERQLAQLARWLDQHRPTRTGHEHSIYSTSNGS